MPSTSILLPKVNAVYFYLIIQNYTLVGNLIIQSEQNQINKKLTVNSLPFTYFLYLALTLEQVALVLLALTSEQPQPSNLYLKFTSSG
jgi:hypothetical protein